MNYALHLAIYLSIYAVVALSLNLVLGYCGLLSLAHAAYFAVGAYTYAIATLRFQWGFLPAAGLSILVAAILSLAVSLPAWRFRGDYFVLMSLAVQVSLFSLISNWYNGDAEFGTLRNLTNGPYGVAGISRPTFLGHSLSSMGSMAGLAVLVAIICSLVTWRLVASPWGRLLKSMRDDELAARSLGKSTRKAKLQAFAAACGMVALAGAVYASYVGYIEPGAGSLEHTILMLSMVIVGGAGNFRGPIAGAAILIAIPELSRVAHVPLAIAANLRLMVYGLLMVVLMRVRPQGIAGDYRVE